MNCGIQNLDMGDKLAFLNSNFLHMLSRLFLQKNSESLKTYSSIFGTNGKGNKPYNVVSKYISQFIIKSV